MTSPLLWMYDHTTFVLVGTALLCSLLLFVVLTFGEPPDVR